jgi:DNA helicase-2/ATP-dependent DNA helicase PcrA
VKVLIVEDDLSSSVYLEKMLPEGTESVRAADGEQALTLFAESLKSGARFDITLDPPDSTQVGAEASDKEDDKLVLSTIHSAKGLEWHTVFVISLIDGYLPSSRSLNTKGEIEEERRLLYVACTRAEKNLYLIAPELSYSRGFSAVGPGMAFSEPSRFLHEMDNFDELAEEWFLDME